MTTGAVSVTGVLAWVLAATTTATETTTTGDGARETSGIPFLDQYLDPIFGIVPGFVLRAIATVAVLVGAYVLSRLLVRMLGRRLSRYFRRPSLTRTAIRGVRVSVFVLALLTVMWIYGLRLSDIAISVGIFSAVVGVVLAPVVGSIISGVFLLADQPYEIGDMVEIVDTDKKGFIEDITLRYTKVFTMDNTFLVVPNGEMRKRDIINFSAEDSRTRQTLNIVVTYEGDLDEARDLFERSARKVDGIIEGGPSIRIGAARYPAGPTCYIREFGNHGVHLFLRYWVEEPYKLGTMKSKIQTEIWSQLEDADVEMAYPHSHVVFDETSGELPVRMTDGDPPSPDVGGETERPGPEE